MRAGQDGGQREDAEDKGEACPPEAPPLHAAQLGPGLVTALRDPLLQDVARRPHQLERLIEARSQHQQKETM